jgi:hypothetical protein
MPYCKWHSHSVPFYIGRAVLWALDFGTVEDLRFWDHDLLPGGTARCDRRYRAVDELGLAWARCTRPATKRVKVTEDGKIYEAKVCTRCVSVPNASLEILEDLQTQNNGDENG